MLIRTAEIQNYMNISHASLVFTKGFNVLWGENRQGKSSVLEAIAMCLIDRKRGDSWKDYIKNGEDFFDIELRIQMSEDEDDIMYFHYKGKKSSGSIEKTVKYKGNTYLNSEANTFLDKTFDQEMISQVLFSLQDSDSAIKMTPAKRRDIFKTIFNTDFPEAIAKIVQDKKKVDQEALSIETEIKVLSGKKYNFFRILVVDESQLEVLKKELQESEASELDKEKYKHYTEKVQELNTRQQTLAKQFEGRQEAINKVASYEAIIAKHQVAQKALDDTVEDYNRKVEAQTTKVGQIETQKKEQEAAFDAVATKKAIDDIKKEVANTSANIKVYQKHIEYRKKGVCEYCGAQHEQKDIDDLLAKIELEKVNLKNFNNALAIDEKVVTDYQLKNAEFSNSLYKAKDDLRKLEAERAKVLASIVSYSHQIAAIQETSIPQQREWLIQIEIEIVMANEAIYLLQQWCEQNKIEVKQDSIRSITDIQIEIDSILAQIASNKERTDINKKLTEERAQDQETVKSLTLKLNDKQLLSERLGAVKKIYEIDFPSHINLKACKILQDSMNTFFETTADKFQVFLDQDSKGINFYYKAADEPNWNPGKMVSGFETALLTLGFKTAVASAFGSDWIVLDEPDRDASPASSERLFENISNIKNFQQFFVITHQPKAMEMFREMGANIYHVAAGVFNQV